MKTAIYAGSFDPVTYGHLNIIERSIELYDKLIVVVAHNTTKKTMFTPEERVQMIRRCFNIEVVSYQGLIVNFAKENNASVLIRGIRNTSDFEYESNMAFINKKLNPEIETVFILADQKYIHLSSSMARELHYHKASLKGIVPQYVEELMVY